MSISQTELLTSHFYEWEARGRGWYVHEVPVDLEPPFYPFFYLSQPTQVIDDGVRPTLISRALHFLSGKSDKKILNEENENEETPFEIFPIEDDAPLKFYTISLPKEEKIQRVKAEQLLLMLTNTSDAVSFEIIATHTHIAIQIVCREPDALHIVSQLKAYFPVISIREGELPFLKSDDEKAYLATIDFGLREEFMRPLSVEKNFDPDPLIGLFGSFENLQEHEQAMVQILFKGARNSWAQSIIYSVTDYNGEPFFLNAPEMTKLAEEKIQSPLFGVVIRSVGGARTLEQAYRVNELIGNALMRISDSGFNGLIPIPSEEYDFETRVQDIALRQSHRVGMLLNTNELATFVHLPSESVVSNKLIRDIGKTKTAPSITEGHSLVLGINEHQGKQKVVTVSDTQRLKHTHIVGATGTGKSTFLLNIISQDIKHGNGIAVCDPHGDLIESILAYIPEERIKDVIIIDPADSEYPVGFNILSAHSEIEKNILSSDLVAAFKRLSSSWGDQMNSVLANAILAFLESDIGGTLLDMRRFLVEKSFRDSFLKSVKDPSITYYWNKEFPLLKSNSVSPILTRLDTFLRPKLIRNMVAQKKSLDFENILDSKKILLVKLSQGLIGTENSYLLGTFIVSKIHQAAMARQAKSKEDRNDFFLYIDEFQNFITPSMSGILSGARKYHLGLILAHQDMAQLSKYDTELASSVMSNAGTRICFRVGDLDAKRFESGFKYFDAEDLENLNTGEAIVRIDRSEFDFNLTSVPLQESQLPIEFKDKIIESSREKYGTPKQEVEKLFEGLRQDVQTEKYSVQEVEKQKLIIVEQPKETVTPIEIIKPKSTDDFVKQKEITQHRYLQTFIKRMAEARGYKALIEEPTPDGKGRVDVHLERSNKKIAVEISVTTENDWEIHNIEKCLSAGYDFVFACSTEMKVIEAMQKKVTAKFDEATQVKILCGEPETLFHYLDSEIANNATTETRVKGYRVKVKYDSVSQDEMKKKRESVAKVVADSLKKLKR